MMYKTFAEVNETLDGFAARTRLQRGAYVLDRMYELMELLGNPQDTIKIVHVAGTSGKTSTSYYIAALLHAAGTKVGLTVSPHAVEVNERVQIGLMPLPESKFCSYFSKFMNTPGVRDIDPTYFELMVAFAYWIFAQEKVDYAVVEVGLGGLLDGTNVIDRPDKVCVITDIGLDHTRILGSTTQEIAAQKAGIIKSHNPVFMMQQAEDVAAVIQSVAQEHKALLTILSPQSVSFLKDLPPFQQRNWQLAQAVYDFLHKRDGLVRLTNDQLKKAAYIRIPARMEILSVAGKTVVLDGSHNQQKLRALRIGLAQKFDAKQTGAVISFGETRQEYITDALHELIACTNYIVVTSFTTSQDSRHRSVAPEEIVAACNKLGFENIEIEKNPHHAFQKILNRPEPVILVTGSFYLLNHIDTAIKELQ